MQRELSYLFNSISVLKESGMLVWIEKRKIAQFSLKMSNGAPNHFSSILLIPNDRDEIKK